MYFTKMREFANELIDQIKHSGEKELKKYLIKHSKKIKKIVNLVQIGRYNLSLLYLIIRRDFISATKILLEAGANVNILDSYGCTPLAVAIYLKRPEMVELLLKYKPDFSIKSTRDAFYACFSGTDSCKRRIIRSMIKHGFDTMKDPCDSKILMTCIKHGFMDMAISITRTRFKMKKFYFLYDILAWSKYLKLHSRPYTKIQNKILNRLTSILNLFHIRDERRYIDRIRHVAEILCREDLRDLKVIHILINNTNFYDFEFHFDSVVQNIILNCYDANKPICDSYQRNFLHYICSNYYTFPEKYGSRLLSFFLKMNFDINAVDINGMTPIDYVYQLISENYCLARSRYKEEKLERLVIEFRTHITKLYSANSYVSYNNSRLIDELRQIIYQCKNGEITPYDTSIEEQIEKMMKELGRILKYKIRGLSLYHLFFMDTTNFHRFQNKKRVKKILMTNNICKKFPFYGPLLQYKYEELHIKRGLVRAATTVLYETLMYKLPEEVVHQIVLTFTINELFKLLYVDP